MEKKQRNSIQKLSVIALIGTIAFGNFSGNILTNVNAVYENGNFSNHEYDTLSTEKELKLTDQRNMGRIVETSDRKYKGDWILEFQLTDQNGDVYDEETPILYPGEKLYIKYTIQYIGKSAIGAGQTVKRLWNSEFMAFSKRWLGLSGNVKLISTNPNNNPTLIFTEDEDFYIGRFLAVDVKPNDTITMEIPVKTPFDLKERILAYFGYYPKRVNIDTCLFAQYKADRISMGDAIGWTQDNAE